MSDKSPRLQLGTTLLSGNIKSFNYICKNSQIPLTIFCHPKQIILKSTQSSGVNGTHDLNVTYSRSAYQNHQVLPDISHFSCTACMMHTYMFLNSLKLADIQISFTNLSSKSKLSIAYATTHACSCPSLLHYKNFCSNHTMVTAFQNYSSLCGLLRLYRSGVCFLEAGAQLICNFL